MYHVTMLRQDHNRPFFATLLFRFIPARTFVEAEIIAQFLVEHGMAVTITRVVRVEEV